MLFSKYREYGFSPLPITPGTKACYLDNWNEWCEVQPTEEECELWDESKMGLGICFGYDGLFGIDNDSIRPEFASLLPPSPVIRIGRYPREMRMYRAEGITDYSDIALGEWNGEKEAIQFMWKGRQAVMPPTIHPKTGKPYYWKTQDRFPEFSVKDLPVITQKDIDTLRSACVAIVGTAASSNVGSGGRNDTLKSIATAMFSRGDSPANIVEELIRVDEENHNPPLFSDPKEKLRGKSANDKAWSFVTSIMKSCAQAGVRPDAIPNNFTVYSEDEKPKSGLKDLPMPTGMLKLFYDSILKISPSPRPQFAMSGALGLMSALNANRFELNDIRPNLYIMNLGRTGSGKDAPRKFNTLVLQHERMRVHNLFGITKYVSGPATILDLPSQRQRLDVVDEFSGFLKSLNQRESTIYNVATELTALWSINGGWYGGIKSVGRGDVTGACYSPSVSILGFCQPDTFISNVTREVLDVGFLPRFLVFQAGDDESINPDFLSVDVEAVIESTVEEVLRFFEPVVMPSGSNGTTVILDGRIKAKKLYVKADSKKQYMDMYMHYSSKTQSEQNEYTRAVTSRAFEQIVKLSQHTCVSDDRDEICKKDLDFSSEMVETLISNSMFLAGQLTASNERERNMNELISLLDEQHSLSSKDIHNKFRRLNRMQKKDLIQDLLESGFAVEAKIGDKKVIQKVKNWT